MKKRRVSGLSSQPREAPEASPCSRPNDRFQRAARHGSPSLVFRHQETPSPP
jgi:hypothetical protein